MWMYAVLSKYNIYTSHNYYNNPTFALQINIKNNTSYNIMEKCHRPRATVKPQKLTGETTHER